MPGPGTDAVRVRGEIAAHTDEPGVFVGEVALPVRGGWILELAVSGAAGEGVARVPVAAAAPDAIPTWLGWAIGLAPTLGLAAFAWRQRRYLRRLQSLIWSGLSTGER